MRKKGEKQHQVCENNCNTLGIMISPLVSKVNPSHLADFATHSDRYRRSKGLWGLHFSRLNFRVARAFCCAMSDVLQQARFGCGTSKCCAL
jgi:hypothetical protein